MTERIVKPVSDPAAAARCRLHITQHDLRLTAEYYACEGGQANWDCVLAAKAALDKARAESEKQQ